MKLENLDKKIKKGKKPLTVFDVDLAIAFEGQEGYFSDYSYHFENLDRTAVGCLKEVDKSDDADYPFLRNNDEQYYRFFLPAEWVLPAEAKFRAYSLKEFTEEHTVGEVIVFRRKGDVDEHHWQYSGFETHPDLVETMPGNGDIFLGPKCFSLSTLFNDYEMFVWNTDNPVEKVWQPFGVKD